MSYKGLQVKAVRIPHEDYVLLAKGITLRADLASIGRNRKYAGDRSLRANRGEALRIVKAFKVRKDGITYTRYIIKFVNHASNQMFFVTGSHDFVKEAYLQSDKHHKAFEAKMLHWGCEHSKAVFTKWNVIRTLKPGTTLHVAKIVKLNRGHFTRLKLTNGHWITANKHWVAIVKH